MAKIKRVPKPKRDDLSRRREAFGRRVRELREARGYSQERLAELADLERKTINRIETAQTAADLDRIFELADALGVEPADLFPPARRPARDDP